MRTLFPGDDPRVPSRIDGHDARSSAVRAVVRRRRTLVVAAVAATTLVALGTGASPASWAASGRTHASGAGRPEGKRRAVTVQSRPQNLSTSQNWSGYVAFDTIFSSVSASWIQPTVTCPERNSWTLFWVGLDGWNGDYAQNQTVEQGGTSARCQKGTPTYTAFWEMWPSNSVQSTFAVNPGDQIDASVVYVPSTQEFVITVSDVTTGGSMTKTTTCAEGLQCARLSAEWVAEAPSRFGTRTMYPLANYRTMSFTSAQAIDQEGIAGSISEGGWSYSGIERIRGVDTPRAKVSGLLGGGTSFRDTWKR
jgi:hypothetical protein